MQSNQAESYTSTNEIAAIAKRRVAQRATQLGEIQAWAGAGILITLFVASLVYVVFGGAFAFDASPAPEGETLIAERAVITADAGGPRRAEHLSAASAAPTDYFPSAYANQSRGEEGNVMTYEHD